MENQRSNPALPDGVDDQEYKRIRKLMRASVLSVWRGKREVIAGVDPWDVVDEAWSSMAHKNFECEGPFIPFALRVAKNKAFDVLRRGEAKRVDRSMDEALDPNDEDAGTLHGLLSDSKGADVDYFRGLDQVKAVQRLALVEEAIYEVLTDVEREIFLAVRVDRKSGAAVGRELIPPVSGQRVGQIVAKAFIKIQAHLKDHEQLLEEVSEEEESERGDDDERV